MSSIKRIEPGPRMSKAVIHNDTVYVAGQIGDPETDVTTQTTDILAEIERILGLAGSEKAKILQSTIWLASMDDFEEMNAVWDKWVDAENPPTRATGESALRSPSHKVEIIVTAAL